MNSTVKHASQIYAAKTGANISLATTILAIITFGIAICTPPLSGPFCQGECLKYPYHEIMARFPRDYFWMYPAILLSFSYLIMMIVIHYTTPDEKKIFSATGVSFALMSTLILSSDYFIQVSFIQPSILAGETEGIAMLSQYNPHGIFILLEELGFICMNVSFFCLIPVFSSSNSLERSIRATFLTGLIFMVVSFLIVTIVYGIRREYRFEIIVISITWIELIVGGILLKSYFSGLTGVKNYLLPQHTGPTSNFGIHK